MNPDGERSSDNGSLTPMPAGVPLEPLEPLTGSTPPTPPPPNVPAGWYPDPDNASGYRYGSVPSMRYFDGVSWTDQRAPMQRNQQARQQQPNQPIYVTQQVVNAPHSPVVVVRGGTSHGFHLVLTILTCGMWLPVWLIIAVINGTRGM